MKLTVRLWIACLALIAFSLSVHGQRQKAMWKEVKGVIVPVPPSIHPRLYLQACDVPALKERIKTPQGQQVIKNLQKLGIDRTPAEEARETDRAFRYYYKMRGVTSRAQLPARTRFCPPCTGA